MPTTSNTAPIKSRVHITPHMHWDREWYFTTEESRILLVNNMEEIMTRLESDPEYPFFVLDGQTSILEDYFAIKPENKARFKKLVAAGKLIIGPWYTQTDTMIVSGESILRNLLYGFKDTAEFGPVMKIGYLPDSFAMSSQLPHIFNGFGITDAMFWRGCSERHGTDKTEFRWQSHDGSLVNVQVLPLGYAIGKYLPESAAALQKRLDQYLNVLEKASVTQDILLPNGHDQMPLQQNIFDIIKTLKEIYPQREFMLSRFETVFDKIRALEDQLPIIKGEFNDGKYMRVHRTISSTRMDIKIAHAQIENKIVNILEPLASIAYDLGFEYHHGFFEKMWKEILKNHAHDSIGCCCSDKVHAEVMNRFILADDMAQNLIQFYMRKIVDNMGETQADKQQLSNKITLFNTLPYARTEIINTTIRIRAAQFALFDTNHTEIPYFICNQREIDPGLIDRQIVHYGNYEPFIEYDIQFEYTIPAMGYCTLHIESQAASQNCVLTAQTAPHQNVLENVFYHIEVTPTGKLNILDKRNNQRYLDVLTLEEGSDDGDEYDYSPLLNDWILYANDEQNLEKQAVAIEIVHQAHQSVAKIEYTMNVPKDLQERAQRQKSGTMSVSFTVTLANQSPRIDIRLKINNQAKDHRVRVFIPTPFMPKTVIADNQFGCITRSVNDHAMAHWLEEDWKEAPIPVWSLMNFVALESDHPTDQNGLAVFTEGLREFEVIDQNAPKDISQYTDQDSRQKNTIALTVFRSVGFLGKEEMVLRPGRPSGIKLPTPDSQMLGELECHFSLMPYQGNHISAHIMASAREYVTPIQAYNKTHFNAMKLNLSDRIAPQNFSLFTKSKSGAVISAFKKAENADAFILRVYNPSETATINDSLNLDDTPSFSEWAQTDMNEIPLVEHSDLTAGEFAELKPCQSKTVRFRFKK